MKLKLEVWKYELLDLLKQMEKKIYRFEDGQLSQCQTDLDGDGKYDKNVVYSYDDEGKFKGVLDLK